MTKSKKKKNFFPIILTLIILFFSIIIFLSIPVLFNYKSIESQIEKKFYSEFNINLKILDKINYQFVPQPHLLINKANLNLNTENIDSTIIKTENLKIFMSTRHLYPKSNLKFNKVEIQNTNFKFKLSDIKNFRDHLYNKKNNRIVIKKSKLFYMDADSNTILISPIDKLFYFINKNDNYKKLKIDGNIFDINYVSIWKRYDETPHKSYTEVKFRNPNIVLENLLEFKNNSNFNGESSINFLNDTITVKYYFNDEKIRIVSPNLNEKIKIISNIELNPFYFESDVTLIEQNLKFLIDEILHLIINNNPEFLGNLNGSLNINLNDLDNEFINEGQINLKINEKTIEIKKASFKIDGGLVQSSISYIEKNGDLIFITENILNLKNKKKFAKKFQINLNKIKHINKVYFNLKKNVDTGKISISGIKINNLKNENLFNKIYNVNNIQELRSLLKTILYS
tara:strand:+ start:273 stop:1637 length:1365 start_codon:yes stop_codon:yes gene_type:complete